MCALNFKEPIKLKRLKKVILLNMLFLALVILSLKLPVTCILLLVLMPIYCKFYLKEDLFTHFIPLDLFSTILFEISLIPGGLILMLADYFRTSKKVVAN